MSQYQLLPPLSGEEYEALKADIAERGVQVPIEYDEHGNILDGHHRAGICEELGIKEWPSVVRSGMSEEAKAEHVLSLNLDRRHLSREQRRELVASLRRRGWSLRRIAGRLGVVEGTIRNDVQETGAQNYAPPTVIGADGKTYPATRAAAPAPTYQPVPAKVEAESGEAAAEDWDSPVTPFFPVETIARPHVANNSGENEWYTPAEYIEAVREVMGGIDLDPASHPAANQVVQAARFFTAADDGLVQDWQGRVWMNPPYAQPLIAQFAAKLAAHLADGSVPEACVLVNNATETAWFQLLARPAVAICFPRGRVRFWAPDRIAAPLQGQAVIYTGPNTGRFLEHFGPFGLVMRP